MGTPDQDVAPTEAETSPEGPEEGIELSAAGINNTTPPNNNDNDNDNNGSSSLRRRPAATVTDRKNDTNTNETITSNQQPQQNINPNPSIHSGGSKQQRKPKKKRLRWIVSSSGTQTQPLSAAQEMVFLTMQLRKMRRRVHGRKVKGSLGCECCILIVLVLVIFGVGMYWVEQDLVEDNNGASMTNVTSPTASPTYPEEDGNIVFDDVVFSEIHVVANSEAGWVAGLLLIILWIVAAFVIITKSPFSPWWRMLKWGILYLPLVFIVFNMAFDKDDNVPNGMFLAFFIVSECVVVVGFVGFFKLYPFVLRQQCFSRRAGRAARLWQANIISDWTMTYHGFNHQSLQNCKTAFTCKYEGKTCPDTQLPQGLGRWLDDAWEGEMITGYWKQGQPVAPFSSWSYGTDDAVAAVRVAYFIATDDPFEKNYPKASNAETMPTCGIASVECSVSGSFYQHLPEATLLEGPYNADTSTDPGATDKSDPFCCYTNAVRQIIQDLTPIQSDTDNDNDNKDQELGMPNIEIRTTDTRGVQVVGHVYEPTGKFFANDVDSVTVSVDRASLSKTNRRNYYGENGREDAMRQISRNNIMFLPKASSTNRRASLFGKIVMVDVEDGSDSSDDSEDEQQQQGEGISELAEASDKLVELGGSSSITMNKDAPPPSTPSFRNNGPATLRVHNWIPATHKEALIFLPGYNSCTRDRLQNFGQFLAMSKLSSRVYPFVFCWPGSVGPGMFQASQVSGTIKNFDNIQKLVASIRAAGIRTVHFMTHSMGVQGLLGAFADEYNEKGQRQGRSKLSQCFQLSPSFSNEEEHEDGSISSEHKLICKTITLLNPDFPLEGFIDRGFLSIRRICKTVTVVGDRNDQALWWSSLLNGAAARQGYEHWGALRPTILLEKRPFSLQQRIGRSIDSLHFPPLKQTRRGSQSGINFKRLVFNERTSLIGGTPDKADDDTIAWLDMDVIDMTGLDTNIAGLRHSGFSLNGLVIKDLEELLTTGKRAMKRSTLVYRDGNMFSYAHAPSFVSL